MLFTPADIAMEVAKRYHSQKDKVEEGKRGILWVKIVEDLFNIHGERLGYDTLPSFMSLIKSLRHKEADGQNSAIALPKIQNPENKFAGLPGGEGLTSFTSRQISIYGLNPDSY